MMVKAFDMKLTGYISLKKVAVTFCVLSSPLPTEEQLKEYKDILIEKKLEQQGNDFFIGKNTFNKVPAWFDENEKSIDKPQTHPYPRIQNLKTILFDIMKDDDCLLNIGEFTNLLTFKVPGREIKVYADAIGKN